jgi:hypothetical protein
MPTERARARPLNPRAEPPPGDALPPELPAQPRWWGRPLAGTRWQLELTRLLADPLWHGTGAPRDDGRPVVLLPGFLVGDQALAVLTPCASPATSTKPDGWRGSRPNANLRAECA